MKVASLKGGRDGRLVVVSKDLTTAIEVPEISTTLQAALDDWDNSAPLLQAQYERLCSNPGTGKPFIPEQCESPLPRAYHWVDGSAYVNHVELVRKARGAEIPASFWTDPLVYQGGSDTFYGPHDPIQVPDESWGIDMEAEIAVITDDVPMGTSCDAAADHIKLIMLVNDVSLRNLIPPELAKGFGFYHGKPSTAFSPVAVTPDETESSGAAEADISLPLLVRLNGEDFGKARPDIDRTFGFPELITHTTKSRHLAAGTIVGSGTVSNKFKGGPGKEISAGGVGYSCIAELRCVETIEKGAPSTNFMQFGDRVEIEMLDNDGQSIFGCIDQIVEKY
ncbi:MAG: 2-keto-4-pentenoate hydratase [Woeseia sp.]|nr:2-keto-4-pentenoate hydratase [Woeseia sp.]|tara:strand:+ start:632 stop:1639 length:1008 start_codon:yes stop_codon:yes gene_type:complete